MTKVIIIIIEKIVSYLKNEVWYLDKNIPLRYLIIQLRIRIMMIIRGFFYNPKLFLKVFIGKKVDIYCSSMIKTNGILLIDDYSHINALSTSGINFGNNVSLGNNTTIICSGSLNLLGKGLSVGNNVGLGRNCFFGCSGGIKIGNDTIFGNFVSMHSENHNFNNKELLIRKQGVNRKGIIIGNNCWIGAKATILDGVIIEDNVIIAAGALLKDGVYRSGFVYGGVPAKILKEIL